MLFPAGRVSAERCLLEFSLHSRCGHVAGLVAQLRVVDDAGEERGEEERKGVRGNECGCVKESW